MLLGRAVIGDTSCFGEVVDDRFHLLVGDVFGEHHRSGQSLPIEDVVLGAPLVGGRLIAVMGGFLPPDTSRAPGDEPMWVPKACNYVGGERAEIPVPAALTGPVNMEAELAVVVGRPLRNASPAEATAAIFGWSVLNDLTATEYVKPGLWATAKSIDGFASWGPWIRRDLSEERVLDGLAITGTVNGVKAQSGNTHNYKFAPSEILSHISHRIGLSAGDVVCLGTPLPPPEVAAGDQVVCEVEEVGVLNNYLVAEGEGNRRTSRTGA